jgi:two-component system alkaline phosphatase synthesis response regulator PhoP
VDNKILIIEDEPALATTLADRLRKQGYTVSVARDGTAGLAAVRKEPFALIILDLVLPGEDGLSVCGKLRADGKTTPILMLTARRQTSDKVTGLRAGGDDYLTKPFQMAELLARVEALLRRSSRAPGTTEEVYQLGDLRINLRRTEVSRDGRAIELSAMEFKLLCYFLEHRGATISREELLREVWGYDAVVSSRTVDMHIAWLRQKLEKDPKYPRLILTVVGLGYKFTD